MRAIERMRERLYKDRIKTTGRLPTGKESRHMEKAVEKIARETDYRNKGK